MSETFSFSAAKLTPMCLPNHKPGIGKFVETSSYDERNHVCYVALKPENSSTAETVCEGSIEGRMMFPSNKSEWQLLRYVAKYMKMERLWLPVRRLQRANGHHWWTLIYSSPSVDMSEYVEQLLRKAKPQSPHNDGSCLVFEVHSDEVHRWDCAEKVASICTMPVEI